MERLQADAFILTPTGPHLFGLETDYDDFWLDMKTAFVRFERTGDGKSFKGCEWRLARPEEGTVVQIYDVFLRQGMPEVEMKSFAMQVAR